MKRKRSSKIRFIKGDKEKKMECKVMNNVWRVRKFVRTNRHSPTS